MTGVAVGGSYLAKNVPGTVGDGEKKLALSELKLPGPLTAATAARLRGQGKDGESPRYTSRSVDRPTPTATALATPSEPEPEPVIDASGGGVMDRTAAEERRAEEAALAALEELDPESARAIAADMMAGYGWSASEFECLDELWMHESGWRADATNPSSGAYGIPQALPAERMASHGSDWQTNPATQIAWGLDYIATRYESPCGAWYYWQTNNWY